MKVKSEIFRKYDDQLPDNFGIDWVSGVYGASAIAHPQGAWQIYQHSGNKTFLEKSYQFYKDLYWEGINGQHWFYAYDSGRYQVSQSHVIIDKPKAKSPSKGKAYH